MKQIAGQMNLFDRDMPCGKMSAEHFQTTDCGREVEHLRVYLGRRDWVCRGRSTHFKS